MVDEHRISRSRQDQMFSDAKLCMIYSLAYPETGLIFYVGSTTKPHFRLACHMKRFGFVPVFEELETVSTRNIGKVNAAKAEVYWIQQMVAWGFSLVNDKSIPKVTKFNA